MNFFKLNNDNSNKDNLEDELRGTLSAMVTLGLVEISGYTDSFEPRYSITALGVLELQMSQSNGV